MLSLRRPAPDPLVTDSSYSSRPANGRPVAWLYEFAEKPYFAFRNRTARVNACIGVEMVTNSSSPL